MIAVPLDNTSNVADRLKFLVAALNNKRGTAKEWQAKRMLVTKWVVELDRNIRILAEREVHLEDRHLPAILTFDPNDTCVFAWAPNGEDGKMIPYHVMHFHSSIPYASIVREVVQNEGGTI